MGGHTEGGYGGGGMVGGHTGGGMVGGHTERGVWWGGGYGGWTHRGGLGGHTDLEREELPDHVHCQSSSVSVHRVPAAVSVCVHRRFQVG